LLKKDPTILKVHELDAILAMATSSVLFDVQTMQDMQVHVYPSGRINPSTPTSIAKHSEGAYQAPVATLTGCADFNS